MQAGVGFHDFGGPSNQYREFRDPYHLNDKGKARFTAELVQKHVLLNSVDAPVSSTHP